MEMLGRARRAELLVQMQTYGAMAVKLLRTFTAQTEALAKLKRGGEQTVRAEHVDVYPGARQSSGRCRIGGEREGESIKMETKPRERMSNEPLPLRQAARCLARTRSGIPCQRTAAKGKKCPALMDGLGLRQACLGHHASFRIRWARDSPGPTGGVSDCRSLR
jgi:hypothetical protein